MLKYCLLGLLAIVGFSVFTTSQAQHVAQQSISIVEITEPRTSVIQFGSNANSQLQREDLGSNPASLAEIVTQIPGVAESGQNGLLQTFSIRGNSGQRVQTRFAGIPISSERRAGTGAAFVDPWHLQQIDVLRGPASTFFGSGAIGGVVLLTPRFFAGVEAELAYASAASQRVQSLGMGNDNWSLGLSNRSAADGETPEGTPLHTGFRQVSALLQNRWKRGGLQLNSLYLTSRGSDIGRSNSLFPDQRIGEVAKEIHDLIRLALISDSGWKAQLYAHAQLSKNETLTGARQVNIVSNDSFDWGGRWSTDWNNQGWSGEYGIELDVRDKVGAIETEVDRSNLNYSAQTNLLADQKALGLFAVSALNIANHRIEFGIRQSWIRQHAARQRRLANQNLSGYVAWQWFITDSWSLSSELASAYRIPSLSERYFNGTTGRGNSIGNPNLQQETAPGFDAGLHWNRAQTSLSAHWYIQSSNNYIERVVVDNDTRSFKNLSDGTITGVEIEGTTTLQYNWSLHYGLHTLRGEDADGRPIADIPAAMTNLGVAYQADTWQWSMFWRHRFANSRVATIEQPVDAAEIIALNYQYHLSDRTSFTLYINNALNQNYLISSDEISTLQNKRTLGIKFSHRFGQWN